MNNKNLLILGAGQYGQVAYETAEAMGCFECISFLDDTNSMAIGRLSEYLKYRDRYECAFVAIGNPKLRLQWLTELEKAGYELATLVHPMGYISKTASIAGGCIVEPMVVVQTGAVIEAGVLLCAGCVVNHNSVVQKGCQIDCNAVVPARAIVTEMTKVSCGAVAETMKQNGV